MNIKWLSVLVSVLIMYSCSHQTKSARSTVEEERHIVGGWTESEVSPEIKNALAFAMEQISTSADLEEITSVKTQIVSGKNYDITFTLNDGEEWNAIVYENFKGDYKLTKMKYLSK